MHREAQINAELRALREQCLDIRVQLSLLMDTQSQEHATIATLLSELAHLETRISNRKLVQ